MIVALVAAVARGSVIGRNGGLPWRLPEDMVHFREVTIGHPVVMGRRTWESLPEPFRPLPERRNVVVTRNLAWTDEGAERAASLDAALELLAGEERVSVIGGGELFAEALPLADELVLTELELEVAGDTFFPTWDRHEFVEIAREEHVAADGTRFAFTTYRRAQPRTTSLASTAVSTDLRATREDLDARLSDLRTLGVDGGTLELIVVRPSEGERETPGSGEVTIQDGLVGDRWLGAAGHRMDAAGAIDRGNQLTLMSTRMLELIADRDRWPLSGDNLLVDIGLDREGLPAGSRLAIGDEVVIEISEEPHTGCAKFSARFGSDALRFVNSPEGRELRLRGANAFVVEPGTISVGDAIRRL